MATAATAAMAATAGMINDLSRPKDRNREARDKIERMKIKIVRKPTKSAKPRGKARHPRDIFISGPKGILPREQNANNHAMIPARNGKDLTSWPYHIARQCPTSMTQKI
jgi:hypothetical protein